MKALLVLATLFAAAACASSQPSAGDPSGSGDPGATDDGTLSAFVVDLVQHQTADDVEAVSYESFATRADPDGDANNMGAYASLF